MNNAGVVSLGRNVSYEIQILYNILENNLKSGCLSKEIVNKIEALIILYLEQEIVEMKK